MRVKIIAHPDPSLVGYVGQGFEFDSTGRLVIGLPIDEVTVVEPWQVEEVQPNIFRRIWSYITLEMVP